MAIILIIMMSFVTITTEIKQAEAAIPAVVPIGAAAIVTAALIAAGLEFDTADEAAIAIQEYWDDANENVKQELVSLGIQAAASTVFLSAEVWSTVMQYTSDNYVAGENTLIGKKVIDLKTATEFSLVSAPVHDEIAYVEASSGALAGWGPYFYDIAGTDLDIRFAENQLDYRIGDDQNWLSMDICNTSMDYHYLHYVTYNPQTNKIGFATCRGNYKCENHSTEQVAVFHCPIDAPQQSITGVCVSIPDDKTITDAQEIVMFRQQEQWEVETEENVTALPTAVNPNYDWVNPKTGERSISHPGTVDAAITLTQQQVQSGEVTQSVSLDMPVAQLDEIEFPAFPETITIENLLQWIGSIFQWFWEWLKSIFEMIIGLLQGIYYFVVKIAQELIGITAYINPDNPDNIVAKWFSIPDGYVAAWYAALYAALVDKLPFMVFPDITVPDQAFPTYTINIYGQEMTLVDGSYINQYGPTAKNVLSMGIWLITFVAIWPKIAEMLGQGGGSK